MKNVIKTTIGILAISLASVSVSQADTNRHHRDFDKSADKHYSKKFDRHDHHGAKRKFQHRQYRGNHLLGHTRHHGWKHAGWKRHYLAHKMERKRLRIIKKMRHDRREFRHNYRKHQPHHNYGRVRYVAPVPVVRYRSHSNKVVPVIAGGIIGSSIANNVSHGDPAATLGGAIFGAVIGDAIARH